MANVKIPNRANGMICFVEIFALRRVTKMNVQLAAATVLIRVKDTAIGSSSCKKMALKYKAEPKAVPTRTTISQSRSTDNSNEDNASEHARNHS